MEEPGVQIRASAAAEHPSPGRMATLSSRPPLWLTGGTPIATLQLFSSTSMHVFLWAALAGWPSSWTVPAGRSCAEQMAP